MAGNDFLNNEESKKATTMKGRTMNPLTQFKKIPILPLLIAPALVIIAALTAVPAVATSPVEFGAWSAPINVGPPLNTQYNDTYPILTADGLTVYFTSDRPGGLGGDDLWVSRRESTDAPWGEPENLAILNSPFNDSLSVLITSGNIMYFHSDRPRGCGAGDLWMSRAKPGGDAWTAPVNMGCVVNTSFTEIAPAFYANDDLGLSTIYFGSNRPGGIGDFDLYQTTTTDEDLESAVWGPGVLVPELSSPARDTRTFVRRDGREVFITTNRTGGVGGLDIWVATREDSSDLWSTPVNPGRPLRRIHFIDLSMQRSAANAELFGRGGHVAIGRGERLYDQFFLCLVQIEGTRFFPESLGRGDSVRRRCMGRLPDGHREIAQCDVWAGRHYNPML